MKLQLFTNALATAVMFGLWHENLQAGLFMFLILGFVLSTVDYLMLKYRGDIQ
jgi:hypothetical protein